GSKTEGHQSGFGYAAGTQLLSLGRSTEPNQEHGTERYASQSVGNVPVSPKSPVMSDGAAAKNLYKRAAERRQRGCYTGSYREIDRCVPHRSKPRGLPEKPADTKRARYSQRTVRQKGHQ